MDHPPNNTNDTINLVTALVKAGIIVFLFCWGIAGACHNENFGLLNLSNLFIHEVGHPLFGIFGNDVMTALGGTLLQLLVPLGATVYFIIARQYYSTAFTLFWVASNCYGIAIYMADARALLLPLVSMGGGDDVQHDWQFLFEHWGVLTQDIAIAHVVQVIGGIVLGLSLLTGLYFSFNTTWPRMPRFQARPRLPKPQPFKFD